MHNHKNGVGDHESKRSRAIRTNPLAALRREGKALFPLPSVARTKTVAYKP